MKRIAIKMVQLIAVCLSACTSAHALDIAQLEARLRPMARADRSYFAFSPATMQWLDSVTLSSVSACYDLTALSSPFTLEGGKGRTALSLDAKTYYRLSSASALWGKAEFRTGVTRDVSRTNSLDYVLLAPYVLGDSVGGDINSQRYAFSGGLSRSYGGWTIGAEASYRAELGYRTRDPRIHDIVSDLNITASVARNVSAHYVAAVGVGYRYYQQNSNVEFVNPMNDIQTYPLMGLGSVYNRFVGNSNRASIHSLSAFSVSFQLLSLSNSGPKLAASYSHSDMSFRLRSFNDITVATTATDYFYIHSGWRLNMSECLTVEPTFEGSLYRRKGVEMLFGSAIGSGYDKIGERGNYRSHHYCFAGGVPVEWMLEPATVTVTPGYTYLNSARALIEPRRVDGNSMSLASIAVSVSRKSGVWLWQADADGMLASHLKGFTLGCSAYRQFQVGILGVRLSYSRLSVNSFQHVISTISFSF